MNHKITWLKREEKISKKPPNKPYTSLSLKLSSHGDKYINGFANAQNAHWQEGMELTDEEITVTQTPPNDEGKSYLNFTTPKKEDLIQKEVDELKRWKDAVCLEFPKMKL